MDEYVMKQKIQNAFFEPRAPEALIQKVVLRTQAVTMGVASQKQLETATAEKVAELTARALVGQLASVSELPYGVQPEQLARQLEQTPAFQTAIQGGNVVRRLFSGELLQQITGKSAVAEQPSAPISAPKKEGPGR